MFVTVGEEVEIKMTAGTDFKNILDLGDKEEIFVYLTAMMMVSKTLFL